MSRLRGLLVAMGIALAGPAIGGCGYCDGAVRIMRANLAELRPANAGQPVPEGGDAISITAHETFRIVGDGPLKPGPELMELAGIRETTWFLMAEDTGQQVPSDISADAGGHMCLNGVGFTLDPKNPLPPGIYTLVLRLDQIRWPLVEEEEEGSFQGERAMVRRYRVSE